MVKIAGRPCIGVMQRGCSGWRSKRALRGALSRCGRGGNPVPLHRRSHWPETQHPGRLHIGQGSGETIQLIWRALPQRTIRPPALAPVNSWVGSRLDRGCLPTSMGRVTTQPSSREAWIKTHKGGTNATGQHHKISCSRIVVRAVVCVSCPAKHLADTQRRGVYGLGAPERQKTRVLDDDDVDGRALA